MFDQSNWFKECCEYTTIPQETACLLLEKRDPQVRKDFFDKYQKGLGYQETISKARDSNSHEEWINAWSIQTYNILKMDYTKVVKEKNYTAKLLAREYQKLSQKKGTEKLKVLDYGCGSGYCCRMLIEKFPQAEVTLCDIKGPVLDYAYWRCRQLSNKVEKLEITSETPVPKINQFDLIFCYTVLEHVWYPEEIVQMFFDSLSDNGILIETYGGYSGKKVEAESEDLQRAYDARDNVLDYLNNRMSRLRGGNDSEEIRIWEKIPGQQNLVKRFRNNAVNYFWQLRRKGVRMHHAIFPK